MAEEIKKTESEEELEIISLQDEEGKEHKFGYLTTLEHEDKEYACLQNVDEGDEYGSVEIFEIQPVDGSEEDNLLPVEDELYEVLFNKLMEECDEQCGDECEDENCSCGCDHHHEN